MKQPHEFGFAEALQVASQEEDRFRGVYPGWNGYPRVFGGVVLAQAISAAVQTVDGPKVPNSMHGVFLRPGMPGDEPELHVERVRDGRSFSTRQVSSFIGGKETSRFIVSFAIPEDSPEYQLGMPEVPRPASEKISSEDLPFELVELGHSERRGDGSYEWTRRAWLRCAARVEADAGLQAAAIAYASDITLTAFQPGVESIEDDTTDASLDHALWFHRSSNICEWHLFDLRCVSISSSRSTVQGVLYDDQGRLVASMAQELLIRPLNGEPIVRSTGRWSPETS